MNVLNVLQAAERSIAKATDASHIVWSRAVSGCESKGLRPTRRPQIAQNLPKSQKYKKYQTYFFKNMFLLFWEPRDYQNLLGHVI